jgi:hypothetical protein
MCVKCDREVEEKCCCSPPSLYHPREHAACPRSAVQADLCLESDDWWQVRKGGWEGEREKWKRERRKKSRRQEGRKEGRKGGREEKEGGCVS